MPAAPTSRPTTATRRYLVVVLAALLAFVATVEVFLRRVAIERDDRARRVRAVYESTHTDAFIGDSTFDALFPIEGFENLSPPGASIAELEILAREFYRHRRPGRVVLLAGPQLFNEQRRQRQALGAEDHYGQNLGLPFVVYAFEPGTSRLLARFGPLLPTWLAGRLPPWERPRYDGPLWIDRTPEDRERKDEQRLRGQIPVPDFRRKAPYAAYQRMLARLVERGADLCLLRSPTTRSYRKRLDANRRSRAAVAEFERWASHYDVPYVDGNRVRIRLTVRDFLNSDHLSEAGARRFSPVAVEACFPGEGEA